MIYATAIFLSAFLLFQLELLFGKFFLPWFGGAASVWTTCMMFFQVMLLAGYFYAHVISVRLSRANQGRLHAALLLGSLALLAYGATQADHALLPPDAARPVVGVGSPILALLLLLTKCIGLPFLLLAATSPLLQRWYSQERPDSPYRLYALSNLGSLLALVSYPFVVEPLLALDRQALVWSLLYACFGLAVAWCGLRNRLSPTVAAAVAAATPAAATPVPRRDLALWLLLPACSTALLLAVTNELCQNIAAVPLLWMLPLMLYLLSFIITFQGPRGYPRRLVLLAACIISVTALVVNFYGFLFTIRPQIVFLNLLLFVLCMACHGELVRRKPDTQRLTLFYLMIATGGALGGMAITIGAPLFFQDFWEYHGAVILCWAVLLLTLRRDRESILFTGDPWHTYTLILFFTLMVMSPFFMTPLADPARRGSANGWLVLAGSLLLAGMLIRGIRRSPSLRSVWWPHLSIATVLGLALLFLSLRLIVNRDQCVAASRNFYGVLRVQEQTRNGVLCRRLTHGRVVHGAQALAPEWRRRPVAYYAPGSGIAMAWRYLIAREGGAPTPGGLRMGITGLGTGGLAALLRPGDRVRYYEINPTVTDFAYAHFTYLDDSPGRVEMAPCGDARLAMAQELADSGSQRYDLLVLDAFSGDSIPTHLLTTEAFSLYAQHLHGTNAVLACNISNRFLDLRPLLFSIADTLGWAVAWVPYGGEPPYQTWSSWILMSPNPAMLEAPEIRQRARAYTATRRILWTDNASDVISLIAGRP